MQRVSVQTLTLFNGQMYIRVYWAGKIIPHSKQPQQLVTNIRVGHPHTAISIDQQQGPRSHSHSAIQSNRDRTAWLAQLTRETPQHFFRASTLKGPSTLLLTSHWQGLVTWSCVTARKGEIDEGLDGAPGWRREASGILGILPSLRHPRTSHLFLHSPNT